MASTAVAGGMAAALIAVLVHRARQTRTATPITSPASMFVDDLQLRSPGVHFAVAPDGRTLVVAGSFSGRHLLLRRELDRVDPVSIVNTGGASDPFFSG